MSETLKQYSKRNLLIRRIIIIAVSLIIITAICLASFLLFNAFYYTPFWVNGQSMYPTLNKDAKYKNGELYGEVGSTAELGSYDIDYGFMDTHQNAINGISRFSIIVCKYSKNDTTSKIKRVIALPGETFFISNKVEDNGSLYVANQDGEFELINQPIDEAMIKKAIYPSLYSSSYTLKEDQYFVMGDNRSHSADSRINGPISKDWIIGVVKGLNGKATIGYDEDKNLTPISVHKYWPRYF